jgi:hypothetical protein
MRRNAKEPPEGGSLRQPSQARGEKVDAGFSRIARVFEESRACCDSFE